MTKRGQMLRFGSFEELELHMKRSTGGQVIQSPQTGNRIHADSLARKLREREIQPSVLEALRKHPKVAWAMRQNTGAGVMIRKDVYERLVREGHLREDEGRFMSFGWKGQLDNTGQLRDGRRLDVESKSPTGKLRDEQVATIDAVNGAGGVAFVARGVEDVFRELDKT